MQREELTEFITIGDIEYEVHYEQYYKFEKMDIEVPYSYEKERESLTIIKVYDEFGTLVYDCELAKNILSEVELELIKEKL